jgi:ubiquinone/menaquinone biosynthesis C-methylase UbiE
MKRRVSHPVFARVFSRAVTKANARGQAQHRRELLEKVSGQVVEIGAGTGINFSYYPEETSSIVAIEPDPYLRTQAEHAAKRYAKIRVYGCTAEHLPFPVETFDTGVVCLVLCSVADPCLVLSELWRVIRPGGVLHFYEHVVSDNPSFARIQHVLDSTIWPLLGGGCHCARDSRRSIEDTGFVIEHCKSLSFQPCIFTPHVAPHILGRARRK